MLGSGEPGDDDSALLTTSEGLSAGGSAGLPSRPARLVAFGCHLLLGLEGLGVLRAGGGSSGGSGGNREAAVEDARWARRLVFLGG